MQLVVWDVLWQYYSLCDDEPFIYDFLICFILAGRHRRYYRVGSTQRVRS